MNPDAVAGLETRDFGNGQGLTSPRNFDRQGRAREIKGGCIRPDQTATQQDKNNQEPNTTMHLGIVGNPELLVSIGGTLAGAPRDVNGSF